MTGGLWRFAAAGAVLGLLFPPPRPRPRPEVLSERAAATLADLVVLDAELRGHLDPGESVSDYIVRTTPEVRVPPRPLCLSECCHGKA